MSQGFFAGMDVHVGSEMLLRDGSSNNEETFDNLIGCWRGIRRRLFYR